MINIFLKRLSYSLRLSAYSRGYKQWRWNSGRAEGRKRLRAMET